MTDTTTPYSAPRQPELLGQTVVVIGGSEGIGLETARRARAEGADVILTGRNSDRLKQAALEVGAQRTAAFDANDSAALARFFGDLPSLIDHVMVTAGGPSYRPLLEMNAAEVRDALSDHVVLGLEVARNAVDKMRPGGALVLMGGTGGRRIDRRLGIVSAATAALPPFTAALALELAPVRVNLIAAGFVDTPLSASLLGDRIDERRATPTPRSTWPAGATPTTTIHPSIPGPPSNGAGPPTPADGTALTSTPRVPVKPARKTREPTFTPHQRPETKDAREGRCRPHQKWSTRFRRQDPAGPGRRPCSGRPRRRMRR